MTSHEEWFRDLRTPDRPDYIETGDDTPHPIRHIGDVPFRKGEKTCIKNVLHVVVWFLTHDIKTSKIII